MAEGTDVKNDLGKADRRATLATNEYRCEIYRVGLFAAWTGHYSYRNTDHRRTETPKHSFRPPDNRNPHFPALRSEIQWLFQGPPAQSKVLAAKQITSSPGSVTIEVIGGNATLNMKVEESTDLNNWFDTGESAEVIVPAPTPGTKFFRFGN